MIVTLKTVAQTPHIVALSDSDKKMKKMEKCIFEVFKEVGRTTGENFSHFSIVLNKWEVIIYPRNAGEFFEISFLVNQ